MLRTLAAAVAVACFLMGASPSSADVDVATLTPYKADRVVVYKAERKLLLLRGNQILREYRIALGRNARGHKIKAGDNRTPEGDYVLDSRLKDSQFYRALHISYPNWYDRTRAEFLGVEPGGAIMIHGLPNDVSANYVGHPAIDWTNGCIAVTNGEMDEIWALVDDGTTINIYPSEYSEPLTPPWQLHGSR